MKTDGLKSQTETSYKLSLFNLNFVHYEREIEGWSLVNVLMKKHGVEGKRDMLFTYFSKISKGPLSSDAWGGGHFLKQ